MAGVLEWISYSNYRWKWNYEKALAGNNNKDIPENIVEKIKMILIFYFVLAHFEGQSIGSCGGALKQLSIGFSSRVRMSNFQNRGVTKVNLLQLWLMLLLL